MSIEENLQFLPEESLKFTKSMGGVLRLTTSDRSYPQVNVRWAFPLTHKNAYVTVHDAADEYIGMIKDPSKLEKTSKKLVADALAARYYMPEIKKIKVAKEDLGIVYWQVDTNFGPREFVVRDLRGSVTVINKGYLLLQDVNENRYILDYTKLDQESSSLLERVL
ncbi:MAG: DUF1854 domain-containing protein [Limnochordia bacterium]|jgi:hypothetical protein|nr:DUF1854 domain-containing protein [Limnochordia bacterium]MDD2629724.1 DUF1854 domain-containing protein [Limnochordia bacterium]MDD4517422.1 DUF1854 domain-containing protein [Limnochordia bacterium]